MDENASSHFLMDEEERILPESAVEVVLGNPPEKRKKNRKPLSKLEPIWIQKSTSGVPAIDLFLDFLGTPSVSKVLFDKKLRNTQLWTDVATHLLSNGVKIAENLKLARTKCRMKWYSMEKLYLNFSNRGKKPKYFAKLDSILKKKKRAISKIKIHSDPEQLDGIPKVGASTPVIKTGARAAKRTRSEPVRGKRNTLNEAVLGLLKKITEAERCRRNREEMHFNTIKYLLKENLKEKKVMNQAFIKFLASFTGLKNKKR